MAFFTNAAENMIVDWLFRGAAAPALPAAWYVALLTEIPADDGTPTVEVAGGAYARAPLPRTLAAMSGTQGVGSTAPSAGSSGASSNNSLVTFPAPTADWGTVRAVALFDAAVGGTMWFANRLVEARTIRAGDSPATFLPGALNFVPDSD